MTDYSELVKALRKVADYINCYDCEMWGLGECDTERKSCVLHNAAAAIEALETEIRESMQKCAECGDRMVEPKRGKWILQASGQDCKCSACGAYWIPFGDEYDYKFCPNCGADMRKMEVQE